MRDFKSTDWGIGEHCRRLRVVSFGELREERKSLPDQRPGTTAEFKFFHTLALTLT